MKHFVFKLPKTKFSKPVRTYDQEPPEYLMGSLAVEFGPVVVVSQAELDQENKK